MSSVYNDHYDAPHDIKRTGDVFEQANTVVTDAWHDAVSDRWGEDDLQEDEH